MVRMWTCPFCGGKTRPISINSVSRELLKKILKEMKGKENPVIIKCEKCGKIWVVEL